MGKTKDRTQVVKGIDELRKCGKKILTLILGASMVVGMSACNAEDVDSTKDSQIIVDGYVITINSDGNMSADDCHTPNNVEEIPVLIDEDGALYKESEFVVDYDMIVDEKGNVTFGHNYKVGNTYTDEAGREYVITEIIEYPDGEYPHAVVIAQHIISKAFVKSK